MDIDSVSGTASSQVSTERKAEAKNEDNKRAEEQNSRSDEQQATKEAALEDAENQKTLAKA